MPRHHEVRELPYSAEQMFGLVADVARYGDFLPWVSAVRVRSNSATEMVADVIVGFKGLRENFTSRVHKTQPSHIHVDYLDGPLKHLSNEWRFHSLGETHCVVDFAVDFTFRSSLFERLAGQMFDKALRRMIVAFEQRACDLYGEHPKSSLSGSNNSNANNVA
ncbi:MAG: type II toxin-antitoxin system RatA family toxin [Pseudomonadota bacterium]